jgi:beta-phosphoglucomutase family hydrolase
MPVRKKPQAVIFDMDGVLVDTEPFHYENENRMFKRLGLEIPDEEHAQFTGVATDMMWQNIVQSRNLPYSVAELTELTIRESIGYFQSLKKLDPMPGLIDLLENLVTNKMPLAVASSSDTETMRNILAKSGLRKYFQFTVSRNDVAKSKPAPDVFLQAAQLLGVEPNDCLVFEDSRNGIAAAKAAGMFCIAYSGANSGKQDRSAADDFISSFDDVNSTRFEWIFRLNN